MALDDPTAIRMCPLMGRCVPSVHCAAERNGHCDLYRGVKWLLSFKGFLNHQNLRILYVVLT